MGKDGSGVTLSSKDSDCVLHRNFAQLKYLILEDENDNPDLLSKESQGITDKRQPESITQQPRTEMKCTSAGQGGSLPI